jgi:hypothetical protein
VSSGNRESCCSSKGGTAGFKWHKCSAQGRDSLEDDECTSRPKTVITKLKIQKVALLVCANHSQMVDEVAAAAAWISHGTCHRFLMT